MEATLHYHPHLIYSLFSYQKVIANIANLHKFDAVYSYDIAFRMKISAQNELHPTMRSVQWGVLNTELANKYLGPHTLKSVCSSCKMNGHSAHVCPQKSNASATADELFQFRNVSFPTPPGPPPSPPPRSSRSRSGDNNRRKQSDKSPCYRYNRNDPCQISSCKYPHVCNICRKNHPVYRHVESTSSVPGQ